MTKWIRIEFKEYDGEDHKYLDVKCDDITTDEGVVFFQYQSEISFACPVDSIRGFWSIQEDGTTELMDNPDDYEDLEEEEEPVRSIDYYNGNPNPATGW